MSKVLSLFLISIILPFACLFGQISPPYFTHLSTRESLSFDRTLGIVKDYQGFVWIATSDGLNRYDGKKCVHYKGGRSANSLSNSWIYCLAEDKNKQLWIGTHSGLCRYDRENDAFMRIANPATDTLTAEKRCIYSLSCDKKGDIWMGTNKGLAVFSQEKQQILPLTIHPISTDRDVPTRILQDKQGVIWFVTANGLYAYNPENQFYKAYKEAVPLGEDARLYNFNISLYLDYANNLWIGQWGGGLHAFDIEKKEFVGNYYYQAITKRTGLGNIIKDMQEQITEKGDTLFWVATTDGLAIFDRKKKTFTFFKHDKENPESLACNEINRLLIDEQNILWLALEDKGVDRCSEKMRKFPLQKLPLIGEKNGNWEVVAIIEDKQDKTHNTFWIGIRDYGLLKWTQSNNQFVQFPFRNNASLPLKERIFEQLAQDAEGRIWITTGKGLEYFTPATGNFSTIKSPDTLLNKRHLRSIFIDKFQQIWLGTAFEQHESYHFCKYNPAKNEAQWGVFPHCTSPIIKITEDANGDIWLAARRNGILKLPQGNMKPTTWQLFQNQLNDSLSFPLEVIWDILPLAKNQLEVAGSHVTFWNTEKNTYQNFTIEEGMSHNHTYHILQDKKGNDWFFTRNGLTRKDAKTGKMLHFSMEDGLVANWLYGAVLLSSKGDIFFGSEDKLQVFSPEKISPSLAAPQLVFSEIKVLNEKYPLKTDKLGHFLPISLSWQQNVIDFSFVAFDYLHPERIQYAYKMEGYDKDWIYKGNINTTTYTNLDGGTYIFKVKATNGDGIWGEKELSISLHISPPFWKTWWFFSLILTLFLLLVYLLYRYRIKRLEEKNRFAIKLIESELKMLRAQLNPHFIFNSLHSIHGYILAEEKAKAAEHLARFAKLMRMMLHNSEQSTLTIEEEITTLELYLSLEKRRCKDVFSYDITCDKAIDKSFIHIPTMILQPFVENAIWHGIMPQKQGHISLSFYLKTENLLQIKITDNGIGREKSRLLHAANESSHRSVAINAITERIRLMKNSQLLIHDLKRENGEAAGTCVEILLEI